MSSNVSPKPVDPIRPMIVKIIASTMLVSIMGLIIVMTKLLTLSQTIEIGISTLAVIISFICTRYIYLEHQYCYQKEQALKQALIDQISARFPQLDKKKCVAEYIEQTIESHSNAQIRIETLLHYQKDTKAFIHFIDGLMQEQEDLKVLETLGLRWQTCASNTPHPSMKKHHYLT